MLICCETGINEDVWMSGSSVSGSRVVDVFVVLSSVSFVCIDVTFKYEDVKDGILVTFVL